MKIKQVSEIFQHSDKLSVAQMDFGEKGCPTTKTKWNQAWKVKNLSFYNNINYLRIN